MYETISFTYELGDVYKFSNYDEEYLVEVSGANLNKPVIMEEVVKREVETSINHNIWRYLMEGGRLEFVSSKGRADFLIWENWMVLNICNRKSVC